MGNDQIVSHTGLSVIFDNTEETIMTINKSIFKWAGIASILMSIGFVLIGVLITLDPVERVRGEAFWQVFYEQPYLNLSWRWSFVVVSLLTLAVIPALAAYVRSKDGEWDGLWLYATTLAYIGAASGALEWLRNLKMVEPFLEAYQTGDPMAQIAAKTTAIGSIDPEGFFRYGGLGLWYILMCVMALRYHKMSRTVAYTGIGCGVGYITTLVFGITDTIIMIGSTPLSVQALAAMVAGVFAAPIFHIGLGLLLLRQAGSEPRPVLRPQASVS